MGEEDDLSFCSGSLACHFAYFWSRRPLSRCCDSSGALLFDSGSMGTCVCHSTWLQPPQSWQDWLVVWQCESPENTALARVCFGRCPSVTKTTRLHPFRNGSSFCKVSWGKASCTALEAVLGPLKEIRREPIFRRPFTFFSRKRNVKEGIWVFLHLQHLPISELLSSWLC